MGSAHSKRNSLGTNSHKVASKRRSSHQKSLKFVEANPCKEFFTITSEHDGRNNHFGNEYGGKFEVLSAGQELLSQQTYEDLNQNTSPPKVYRQKSSGSKHSLGSHKMRLLIEKGTTPRYMQNLLKGSQKTVRSTQRKTALSMLEQESQLKNDFQSTHGQICDTTESKQTLRKAKPTIGFANVLQNRIHTLAKGANEKIIKKN